MRKGEIAHYEQFLLFPQCFLTYQRTFCHFKQIRNYRLQALSVWRSLKIVVWEKVNNHNVCHLIELTHVYNEGIKNEIKLKNF